MAQLIFFCGTMDSGKSTLALQTAHNHQSRGRKGLIFSSKDRAGTGKLSSRIGLRADAIEVDDSVNFHEYVLDQLAKSQKVDFIIADEAQFYTRTQIEQLATIVDSLEIDVFTFGILTDFRTELFPGAQRLVELADAINPLQVGALCWCGARATHQARIVNGVMVSEGEQVLLSTPDDVVAYEVLCRRHHMRQVTSRKSRDYFANNVPLFGE
jgi:thymidine kinase